MTMAVATSKKFKIHLNFSWNWILLWNIIGCFSILRLHCLLCSWWFWLQANFFEFFFFSFHIYSEHPRRKSYLTSDGSISNANDKRRRFCYGENVWAQKKNTSKFELFIMRIIKFVRQHSKQIKTKQSKNNQRKSQSKEMHLKTHAHY